MGLTTCQINVLNPETAVDKLMTATEETALSVSHVKNQTL